MSDRRIVDLTSLSEEEEEKAEEDVMNLVSPDKCGTCVVEDARIERLHDQLAAKAKSMRALMNLGKEMRRGLQSAEGKQEPVSELAPPSEVGRKRMAEEKKKQPSAAPCAEEKRQEKERMAHVKKLQRQLGSEKYVLKFIQVVMSPELMSQPLGLAIAQAFQSTTEKAEHERISYRVASMDHPYGSCPMLGWNRVEPSTENGDMLESEEPFTMICLEGKAMIEQIENGGMDAMLNGATEGHTVYILVHRLEQSMRQREAEDHREAMSQTSASQTPGFVASRVEEYMTSLLVERADVDVFDASSLEEAANHVLAITRAIAMRHIDVGSGAKYVAGKSKRRNASASLETLLVSRPLANDDMLYPIRALCALPSVGPGSAHALMEEYTSLKGILEMLDDPRTTLLEKKKYIENIVSANGKRVGPKAAKQIVNLFSSEDANAPLDTS